MGRQAIARGIAGRRGHTASVEVALKIVKDEERGVVFVRARTQAQVIQQFRSPGGDSLLAPSAGQHGQGARLSLGR